MLVEINGHYSIGVPKDFLKAILENINLKIFCKITESIFVRIGGVSKGIS